MRRLLWDRSEEKEARSQEPVVRTSLPSFPVPFQNLPKSDTPGGGWRETVEQEKVESRAAGVAPVWSSLFTIHPQYCPVDDFGKLAFAL
jgi:hypothetical protein